jgi:hypothetical protein
MTIKDQSGVAASSEWLRDNGLGTYNSRTRRKSLEKRVTEPVTFEHWQTVVDMGRCRSCTGLLLTKQNTQTGGHFHICEYAECGWYISWRASDGTGMQVKLER